VLVVQCAICWGEGSSPVEVTVWEHVISALWAAGRLWWQVLSGELVEGEVAFIVLEDEESTNPHIEENSHDRDRTRQVYEEGVLLEELEGESDGVEGLNHGMMNLMHGIV